MLRDQQTPVPASRYRSLSYYHTQKKNGKKAPKLRTGKQSRKKAGRTYQTVTPASVRPKALNRCNTDPQRNSQHAAKSREVTQRSNQPSVKERVSMALPKCRGLKHLNSHAEPATVTRKQRENLETEKHPVYRLNTAANSLLCPELAQCQMFVWAWIGRFRLHMDLHTYLLCWTGPPDGQSW